MSEIGKTEINEIQKPMPENYRDIVPEKDSPIDKVKDFWSDMFRDDTKRYNTYEDRINQTRRKDSEAGTWEGDRGESRFIPNKETAEGKAASEKLAEYGKEGIDYKNGEPDFSDCSRATVKIDDMTENRVNYEDDNGNMCLGNFAQADIECAKKWNEQNKGGCSQWTPRMVQEWIHDNKCTWHERADQRTMDLVPEAIHGFFSHSGGVSECKTRDAASRGGDFDE